jgi:uncharacterized protein
MSKHLNELIHQRIQRRAVLGSMASLGLSSWLGFILPKTWAKNQLPGLSSLSQYDESDHHKDLYVAFAKGAALSEKSDQHLYLNDEYRAHLLIAWADRLSDGSTLPLPLLDGAQQAEAFGYNNDFIAYHSLPTQQGLLRALLSINHEYTSPSLMFPDVMKDKKSTMSADQMKVEMASVGHSVIEVKRNAPRGKAGRWEVQWNSPLQRRLHALGPIIEMKGPAAGHARLKTQQDPSGTRIIGTFSNCAGGQTPWGTTLIAEENVNQHFYVDLERHANAEELLRYGYVEKSRRSSWHTINPRFDLHQTPHEAHRFGWIVELDPYHPQKTPIKRSALGRFKHECATCVLSVENKAVVYSGDDQIDEYLYRYVSDDRYHNEHPNPGELLDKGTLQVAVFKDDASLHWIDLVFGQEPLTPEHNFYSQADVLIETRRAADLVGATPLDRPEDVAVDPKTNSVYVMCTQHKDRTHPTPGSPRAPNHYGHIIQIKPHAGDHAHPQAQWDILLFGGPEEQEHYRTWIKNPDNGAFDPQGHLWITADSHSSEKPMFANGLWRYYLHGSHKGSLERICSMPNGAEPCGPCFSPDGQTLFVSIQHPAEGSQWHTPSTRWPDFRSDRPPRPALIAIEKADGSLI